MITEIIQKIYDMLYSPIITPYNLVENAKLENYESVSFTKFDGGLIAKLICMVEVTDSDYSTFEYYFDKNDSLQKIIYSNKSNNEIIFDRKQELMRLESKYIEAMPLEQQSLAI